MTVTVAVALTVAVTVKMLVIVLAGRVGTETVLIEMLGTVMVLMEIEDWLGRLMLLTFAKGCAMQPADSLLRLQSRCQEM